MGKYLKDGANPDRIAAVKIVCARSVLAARQAFSTLGDVVVLPDREIRREHLVDADALIIRSKTRVTRELLEGTSVKFVGTATAGFDHIDPDACRELDVAWTAAPGCNAISVAEWFVAAMLVWARRRGTTLTGRTLAVIGVGQVGSRVVKRAEILGMSVVQNDPPRALAEENPIFRPLEEVLPAADIVTLHVPLTEVGPFATRQMVNHRFLSQLKPGAVFVNASRGEVVDESALRLALDSDHVSDAILDVWDHEPEIDPELLDRAILGTPHIAGYSWDGKLAGTVQVYRALCQFWELPATWDPATVAPGTPPPYVDVSVHGRDEESVLHEVVRNVYDIERDDRALRGEGAPAGESLSVRFERLRKDYPVRREFACAKVTLRGGSSGLQTKLEDLGFHVERVE